MSKKLFFTILTILTLTFSFTYVFANNGMQDAVNGVRNAIGGAENAVENTAKDVSNASKDVTGDIEKGGKTATNNIMSDTKGDTDNGKNMMSMGSQNDDNSYTATRTATDTPTFMGMSSTSWTWLILGIAALAIIGLVWYYSMQLTGNNYDNGDNE